MAKSNSANIWFEEQLWKAADKMRNNMDPAEYKHIILWLIFLKYISDSFETKYESIINDSASYEWEAEDKDSYLADNVFWVPVEARWKSIQDNAKKPEIGQIIDDAMLLIEKENISLKNILPKHYSKQELDKVMLGWIVDIISTISMKDSEHWGKDILWRVYEYFLWRFADSEWKWGWEFFTPQSIVKLLVNMLEPKQGRIYDPACWSGGMFVQSEKFIEAHGWRLDDIAVYGQESNPTTWKLAKMNLALRWINWDLWSFNADSFWNDLHKDLRASYIIANPPFNISDWGGESLTDDVRWKYWVPPVWNANYAWIQHFIHHLDPTTWVAGFVMANGSMSSNTSSEWEIRQRIIEAWLVDCMVALPSQLFYTTMIPACIWFLSKNKSERKDKILFIDAREMWEMITRKNRELTTEDIDKISSTYHNWKAWSDYEDTLWYCKSASLEEVKKNDYILTPGRYVWVALNEDDDETFEEKMSKYTSELSEQMKEEKVLDERIKENLASIGYKI